MACSGQEAIFVTDDIFSGIVASGGSPYLTIVPSLEKSHMSRASCWSSFQK